MLYRLGTTDLSSKLFFWLLFMNIDKYEPPSVGPIMKKQETDRSPAPMSNLHFPYIVGPIQVAALQLVSIRRAVQSPPLLQISQCPITQYVIAHSAVKLLQHLTFPACIACSNDAPVQSSDLYKPHVHL